MIVVARVHSTKMFAVRTAEILINNGETIRQYEANLEENVNELQTRLRAGQYKAPPVRRVEIPKGEGKVRMLGIPTVEDRLLQSRSGEDS